MKCIFSVCVQAYAHMCKQDAVYLERKPSLLSSLALFCVISWIPRWLLVFRYLFQWQNLAKHWKLVPGKSGCSLTSASSGRVSAAAQGSTGLRWRSRGSPCSSVRSSASWHGHLPSLLAWHLPPAITVSELPLIPLFVLQPFKPFVMSTANWHLPSIFTGIKSCAAAVADFQHPMKGIQGGEQKWGTLCSGGETGRTGLQIIRYFQELILWAQFLYLPISVVV